MAYHTKYRPADFATVAGHEVLLKSIKSALEREDDRPQVWLFTGISGVGKTTIARILANQLGATPSGIFEINIARFRGIDDIRDLTRKFPMKPPGSSAAVYILDEVHQMTNAAQNLILKALEEPLPFCYFILCTTDPQNLLDTFRTRCQEYRFEALSNGAIEDVLFRVIEAEGIEDVHEDTILDIIANAHGSPRLALNLLEKVEPVIDDPEKARPLILSAATFGEGDDVDNMEVAVKLFALISERRPWPDVVKFLRANVIKRLGKEDKLRLKQALVGIMGRKLLTEPSIHLCDAIDLVDASATPIGNHSDGGLLSLIYRTYELVPATASSRSRHPRREETRGDSGSGGRFTRSGGSNRGLV